MGFCNEDEVMEFFRSCPPFEEMLIRNGIILIKYWFSVSDEEQEKRFRSRIEDPTKRWKLSEMDLESWNKWVEYSKAKDEMFRYTDTKLSPWYVVNADDKKRARLNTIHHLLSLIPYEDLTPKPFKLPSAATTPATCARRSRTRRSCPRCTEPGRRSATSQMRRGRGGLAAAPPSLPSLAPVSASCRGPS